MRSERGMTYTTGKPHMEIRNHSASEIEPSG